MEPGTRANARRPHPKKSARPETWPKDGKKTWGNMLPPIAHTWPANANQMHCHNCTHCCRNR
eukprot:4108365-Lingulodinium_polyedra.AAC.1